MNPWYLLTCFFVFLLLPAVVVALRRHPVDGLVALSQGGLLTTFALVSLAVALEREMYLDVALATALVSFAGGVAYAHFLERWL